MDPNGDDYLPNQYTNLMFSESPLSPNYRQSDDRHPNAQALDLCLTYDDSTSLDPNYGFNTMHPGFSTQCSIGGEASASAKPKKKPSKPKKQPEILAIQSSSSTPTSRAARQQWTTEDDTVLVSAYLNASTNPVIGTDRSGGNFWKCIAEYYNNSTKSGMLRDDKGCKNRWHVINGQVGKFVGCYEQATTRKKSGENESDVILMAHTLYECDEKKPFKLVHAWLLLKDEPKWMLQGESPANKRSRINVQGNYSSSSSAGGSSQPTTPGTPCTPISEPTDPSGGDFPIPDPVRLRPMGVKAAKRKAKVKSMPSVEECGESAEVAASINRMADAVNRNAATKEMKIYQRLAEKDILTSREEELFQMLHAKLFQ